MFHIYKGYELVEAYHNMRTNRRFHPSGGFKKTAQAVIVAIITLLLWNAPTDMFGIEGLTIVQQDHRATAHHCYLRLRYADVDS